MPDDHKSDDEYPGADDADLNEKVLIKFVGQNFADVCFRVKKTTQMEKLMVAYSKKVNLSINVLRFLYDGKRVGSNDTPKILDMEEENIVQVFQEQTGGGNMIPILNITKQ